MAQTAAKRKKAQTSNKCKSLSRKQVGLKYGFRSGLEEDVALSLKEMGLPFKYEEYVIEYIKPERKSKYTPDFTMTKKCGGVLIIETKGRFMREDRKKHLWIKEQFPDADIRFVFSNPNSKLYKGAKTTYGQWCEKYGFPYAAKSIPEEWLKECVGFKETTKSN